MAPRRTGSLRILTGREHAIKLIAAHGSGHRVVVVQEEAGRFLGYQLRCLDQIDPHVRRVVAPLQPRLQSEVKGRVTLYILPDGRIESAMLTHSSGEHRIDNAILALFREIGSFDPFPEEFSADVEMLELSLPFVVGPPGQPVAVAQAFREGSAIA